MSRGVVRPAGRVCRPRAARGDAQCTLHQLARAAARAASPWAPAVLIGKRTPASASKQGQDFDLGSAEKRHVQQRFTPPVFAETIAPELEVTVCTLFSPGATRPALIPTWCDRHSPANFAHLPCSAPFIRRPTGLGLPQTRTLRLVGTLVVVGCYVRRAARGCGLQARTAPR